MSEALNDPSHQIIEPSSALFQAIKVLLERFLW